jgi:hypothetical protein
VFRAEFDALGFHDTVGRRYGIQACGTSHRGLIRPPGVDGPGRGRAFLLIGHLDTVFEKDSLVSEVRAHRRSHGALVPASST